MGIARIASYCVSLIFTILIQFDENIASPQRKLRARMKEVSKVFARLQRQDNWAARQGGGIGGGGGGGVGCGNWSRKCTSSREVCDDECSQGAAPSRP